MQILNIHCNYFIYIFFANILNIYLKLFYILIANILDIHLQLFKRFHAILFSSGFNSKTCSLKIFVDRTRTDSFRYDIYCLTKRSC